MLIFPLEATSSWKTVWNLHGLRMPLIIWFLVLMVFLSGQPPLPNFFRLTLKNDFPRFNQRAMERVLKACIPRTPLSSKHHSDVISKMKRLRQSLLLWVQWYLPRSHSMTMHLSCFLESRVGTCCSSSEVVLFPSSTQAPSFISITAHLRTLSSHPPFYRTSLNFQLSKIDTVMNVNPPCYVWTLWHHQPSTSIYVTWKLQT